MSRSYHFSSASPGEPKRGYGIFDRRCSPFQSNVEGSLTNTFLVIPKGHQGLPVKPYDLFYGVKARSSCALTGLKW